MKLSTIVSLRPVMYMSPLLLEPLSFEPGLVSDPGEGGAVDDDGGLYGSMIGSGVLGPSFISTLELLFCVGGALEIDDRDSWICC